MSTAGIHTGETLTAGLRAELDLTYQQGYDGVEAFLGDVVNLGMASDKKTEIYAMHRTMPYAKRWADGDPITAEGTDSLGYSVTNHDYAIRVGWNRNDRYDNQIGDLFAKAQQAGRNFLSLPSRITAEFLNGSASGDLLPALPNAPDGAALFATQDGDGNDRFGVSSGNLLSQTAATAAGIETDFFASMAQFGQFQNTKNQPYFDPDLRSAAYVIFFPITLIAEFTEAFRANLVHSVQSSEGAAVSNVIMASGANVRLHGTQRLTGNDWCIFRSDAPVKALFRQVREGIRAVTATEENSDIARNTKEESVQWACREGWGVNVPFAGIKVA